MQLKINNYALTVITGLQCCLLLSSCSEAARKQVAMLPVQNSVLHVVDLIDTPQIQLKELLPFSGKIETHHTSPQALLAFCRTLIGVPYVYAAADSAIGFDCSGFITYVFNHFNIAVPRSSFSFTNIQKQVPLSDARPGDLVLFTGTDTSIHVVGHMGIIENKANGQLTFIHASSGKANGVTISPLDAYYKGRFVKIIRVFPDSAL